MALYDGDAQGTRFILFGSRDGWLRQQQDANVADDGTAISSFVLLGPYRPVDDLTEAKVMGADFYLGQEDQSKTYNVTATMQGAADAYSSLFNPAATASVTFGQVQGHTGRQLGLRIKGGNLAMKLANSTINTTWNLERVIIMVGKGGKQR